MEQYSSGIIKSMRQENTNLSVNFFSDVNIDFIHRSIKQTIYDKYKVKIDDQNKDDILVLMRTTFLTNMYNSSNDIQKQIEHMNNVTISEAVRIIASGVASYLGYLRDVHSNPLPPPIPQNTSVYGSVPIITSTKIGM